jgi:DNA-binding transcriptional LysR family regulator
MHQEIFMDFTLHQLRIFQAVAQQRSYSRVAERLLISQPGVTMQIKTLERSVGLPLFEKTGRTLQLTEAGHELLAYSERIFALLDEAHVVLEELGGLRRGTVKVAASTTAGIYVAPRALGAFHRTYPALQLSLDVVNRHTVQDLLLTNEVDVALMGLIEDTHDLEVAWFLPNELVVIASPRHPLAGLSTIPMERLVNETFLLREAGSGTRADTESIFVKAGIPLRVGMELRSMGAIKQAVAADLGIAVMPRDALELELALGRLVVLDVVGFPVHRHWSVVRRAGRHASAAAEALWHFLLEFRDQSAADAGNPQRVISPGPRAD